MSRVKVIASPWNEMHERRSQSGDVVGRVRMGVVYSKVGPPSFGGYSGHALGVRFPAVTPHERPTFFATKEEAQEAVDEALRASGVVLL